MVMTVRNQFVMSPDFRPMLAAKIKELGLLQYPLLATPKVDGIRCITREKQIYDLFAKTNVEAVSRVLLPIPNLHIQQTLASYNLTGLDGEIVTYTDGQMDNYNTVQSKVMSEAGTPDFYYHVFDLIEPRPHWDRVAWLKDEMKFPEDTRLRKLLPVLIQDEAALLAYEEAVLLQGFEGVMLRHVDGPYKFGRSTFKQHWLLKLKRFQDAEATVIGFEELMRNQNEQTKNALGLSERSDYQENMVPAGTLGALKVVGHNGIQFNIGTGFDDATREDIWRNQQTYLYQKVKYKYQPHGVKTAPRCPVFLGFRPPGDLDAGPFESENPGRFDDLTSGANPENDPQF
jgi:DNA ligase 1